MLRAIREIQPAWVVGENVSGLISWNGGLVFNEVQTDLEAEGYEVFPVVLPACAVNAPHRRDRVWFIAYAGSPGTTKGTGRCNKPRELFQEAGWQQNKQQHKSVSSGRPTTNPASNRRQRNGQGIEVEKGLQQGSESAWQLKRRFEGLCNTGIIADTPNIGHESSGTSWAGWTGFKNGNSGITSDTCNEGLQGRELNGTFEQGNRTCKPCKPTPKLHQITNWTNFPTESPVRGKYDGISPGLVGITVSKHRNESIKAYGNAIVPQVALMIFKAIEQMKDI